MVNMIKNDNNDETIEITADDIDSEIEITDQEDSQKQIINNLKKKIKALDTEKRELLEDNQRAKADFLNARRRLEEERRRDRQRQQISHIEEILPLADSFELAMSNTVAWQAVEETWRKGVEGINAQLQNILTAYQVTVLRPQGCPFNPTEHEALGTETVDTADKHDTVVKVIQSGYAIKRDNGTTEIIRPARVIIGEYKSNN